MIRQVEKGDYDVTDIYGMDEKTGDVYFQAAMLSPHDRQVYVAHKNGKVERLTDKEGSNSAYFSGDYRYLSIHGVPIVIHRYLPFAIARER